MPFVPGQSGNPSGRPRGAAGLARYIAAQTNDGLELVDRLLSLARDPDAPKREATGAVMALLDRLAGKPMQPSEIALAVAPSHLEPASWSSLTPAERVLELGRIRAAVVAGTPLQLTEGS